MDSKKNRIVSFFRIIIVLFIIIIIFLLFLAYKKNYLNTNNEFNNWKINETTLNLKIGSSSILSIIGDSDIDLSNVTWSSSDNDIVSVDSNGMVIAQKEGYAYIVAKNSDGTTSTCKINVYETNQTNDIFELTENNLRLKINDVYKLYASFKSMDYMNKTIKWSSNDLNVAIVDENGNVTAINVGQAIITASIDDEFFATCTIDIFVEVSDILLDKTSINLEVGNEAQIVGTVLPSIAVDSSIMWISSNSSIATVDDNGKVVAISPGEVVITATTSNGISSSCTVVVSNPVIMASSIVLNKEILNLEVQQSFQLIGTIFPANVSDNTLIWESSNNNVAVVDSNGIVQAKDAGEALITVKSNNGIISTCMVIVIKYDSYIDKSHIQNNYRLVADYNSNSLKYWIESGNNSGYSEYVAHIWVKNAYDQLKVALEPNFGHLASGKDILKNEIMKNDYKNRGMVSTNASGFDMSNSGIWASTQLIPLIIKDGKIIRDASPNTLPNLYYGVYGIRNDGLLVNYVYSHDNNIEGHKQLTKTIISDGIKNTFGFSGTILDRSGNYNIDQSNVRASRTAICQINKNNFILISTGATEVSTLAKKLKQTYNCSFALNLDGGGSTKMYYKYSGTTEVNTVFAGSRQIADMVYFVEQ